MQASWRLGVLGILGICTLVAAVWVLRADDEGALGLTPTLVDSPRVQSDGNRGSAPGAGSGAESGAISRSGSVDGERGDFEGDLQTLPFVPGRDGARIQKSRVEAARYGRPTMRLEGSLEIRSGSERLAPDSATVVLRSGDGRRDTIRVAVRQGQFTTEVPLCGSFDIESIGWSEGDLIPEVPRFAATTGRPVELVAVVAPVVTIAVLDQADGQPLEDLTALHAPRPITHGLEHPGQLPDLRSLGDRLASPITIAMKSARETLFIGGPSRGWARVNLDATQPLPTEVRLRSATTLHVSVKGPALPEGVRVRIFRSAGGGQLRAGAGGRAPAPVAEAGLNGGSEVVIDGLGTGGHLIRLETKSAQGSGVALAEAPVILEEGRASKITLHVRPEALRSQEVRLEGELFIPGGFAGDALRLELMPQRVAGRVPTVRLGPSELQALDGRPGWYGFVVEAIRPGSWLASMFGQVHKVEIRGGETARVRLEASAPATLDVRVIQRGSGAAIPGAIVAINAGATGRVTPNTYAPGKRRPDGQGSTFRVAPGRVVVRVRAPGYRPAARTVEVPAAGHALDIELDSEQGIEVSLWHGAQRVGFPAGVRPRLVPESGGASTRATAARSGSRVTIFPETPGRYRLQFPRIPGYAQIDDEVIELSPGEVQNLRIELREGRG